MIDIQLDNSQSPPRGTSTTKFSINLDSTSTDKSTSTTNPYAALFSNYDGTANPPLDGSHYSYPTPMTVFDENGAAHDLMVYYDPVTTTDGSIVWEYVVTCDASEDMRDFNGTDMNTTSGAGMLMTGTLTFSGSGELQSMTGFTLGDPPTNTTDPLAKKTGYWRNSTQKACPFSGPTLPTPQTTSKFRSASDFPTRITPQAQDGQIPAQSIHWTT